MYIPLQIKSNYNLLSSALKIDDIVMYAKENNLFSIALTDPNMFGVMEFIKKCQNNNIKPLIGLELNLEKFSIYLYAKDYSGYKNLMKLSTIQHERVVNSSDLSEYNKSLIVILPFKYKEKYKELLEIYLEVYLGYDDNMNEKEALSITNNIVFFPENLYLKEEDKEILYYLYCIRDGKKGIENDYDLNNHALYRNIKNINKMALENTMKIASNCEIVFPKSTNLLPIYECDNPLKYLFDLSRLGLSKRIGEITEEYKQRLSYELKIISDMGFANYFLVVYDFIKYAKKNKILVGPGRGSAAGSLVAYSLGITDIDPLKYGLLFERFLNPERKTMPDIDTDFPDNKRDLVIEYVKEKYGEKKVSGIITFGHLAAKQVIRDVGRVLNIPSYKIDALSKNISSMSKDSLESIYLNNKTFKIKVDSDQLLTKMYNIAKKIEGFPRHTSSHAAGIVMSKVDLDEVIPLMKSDNMYLTSYSMEYLEDLGLLKMDFLALKNLTLIDNILKDIKDVYNEEIEFSKIPLDDKETLKLFEEANTCGIFQFESTGMRNFLRKLKPNSFSDVVAAIALFRPGAATNIDSYIKRKEGLEKIIYFDPSLKEITKETYGFLIYQEQIMQLANIYASYTLGEADILRRAMSKKKKDLLISEKEKFIKKSMENNHPKEQAEKLFDLVLNFAGFGFNKSHSVVYSVIAFRMAYLKCHYKTIFFANLLSNVIGSEEKTNEYILEAKANHITVLKPSINESSNTYLVKDDKIVYPLSNIKGVGVVTSKQIIEAKKDKDFEDIYDCFSRLCIAGINKKILETLIYADVFKPFSYNKATLIYNLDSLYNYAELTKDIDPSLVLKPDIEFQKDYTQAISLEKEKEVFGFYLSSHPTTFYLKDNPTTILLNKIDKFFDKTIEALILVEKIKVISTKNKEEMAFLVGSDETQSREFTIFPKAWKNLNINKGDILKVRGRVEKRLNNFQIIVDRAETLQGVKNEG